LLFCIVQRVSLLHALVIGDLEPAPQACTRTKICQRLGLFEGPFSAPQNGNLDVCGAGLVFVRLAKATYGSSCAVGIWVCFFLHHKERSTRQFEEAHPVPKMRMLDHSLFLQIWNN